jgi:hypothetical protein
MEIENENKRKEERAKHIENKRINRITNSIKSNIISTKITRQDLLNIPLSDIDEFTFKNENIHCIGGQIGQAMIILDQILRKLAENNIMTNESVKVPEFIEKFLEEFLINQLKDYQYLELRYLESSKFDFSEIPQEEEKRKEYHTFLLDNRRFVNTSIKLLLEKEILTEYVYKSFLESVAKIYFSQTVDPLSAIEVDTNNQEDDYLQIIEQKKIEIENYNKKMEKMKRKIKLNFIKPDDLKKKRDKIGGFVTVLANKNIIESMIEIEEPVVNLDIKSEDVENKNKLIDDNNAQQVENQLNHADENKVIENNINTNLPADVVENNKNKEPVEPLKIKIDYINEVDVFRNINVPIDTYILHCDMTECFLAYTLGSIKRALAKNYKVFIEMNESFNMIKEKINEINGIVYEHLMKNEKYIGKTIIPIEVKSEQPLIDNTVE